MSSKIHELKTWPGPFDAIWRGVKTCELRKNDRDFKVGDFLELREWNPLAPGRIADGVYTGRSITAAVTHMIASGTFGLSDDLCVLSIAVVSRRP